MQKWKLIIYIPTYNAEKAIPELLMRFRKVEMQLRSESIIIDKLFIINDGSTDKTTGLLSSNAKTMPYLVLINKKKNEGPIKALFDGMRETIKTLKEQNYELEKTIVIRMDSDLEHQPEDIPILIKPITSEKTRISVGYIPFDSRAGFFAKFLNEYVGLQESRCFLKTDIPQFCPGFNAIRCDLFGRLYPQLQKKAAQFKKQYGKDMLMLDFLILALAKQWGERISVIKLLPIEDKWVKKTPAGKLLYYFDNHNKMMEFLHGFGF